MAETEPHSQLLNELKRHFDIVAESLESKIQLVAESVVNVDQKLDRRFDALNKRIEKESEETRALYQTVIYRARSASGDLGDYRCRPAEQG
jgi:threonine aldolase